MRSRSGGFSVVEMVASLVLAALLLGSLYGVVDQSMDMREHVSTQNEATMDLQFAMDRMVRHIQQSRQIILPLDGTPRDVFAVTLPESVDRNRDGYADADNDYDFRVDEDPGADMTNDGRAGIRDIDDDGDGNTDEGPLLFTDYDDDEDLVRNDDPRNGVDDDGDGFIDEDANNDLNGDGAPGRLNFDDDGDGFTDETTSSDDDEDADVGEDWLDPVVYRLVGNTLVERIPVPWDTDSDFVQTGRDYLEHTVLDNVTVFTATRTNTATFELLAIEIEVTDDSGNPRSLSTTVRVGGAL